MKHVFLNINVICVNQTWRTSYMTMDGVRGGGWLASELFGMKTEHGLDLVRGDYFSNLNALGRGWFIWRGHFCPACRAFAVVRSLRMTSSCVSQGQLRPGSQIPFWELLVTSHWIFPTRGHTLMRDGESLFWSPQREKHRHVDPCIRELKHQKYGMTVCQTRGGGSPRRSSTSSPSSCCAEGSLKAAAAAPCVSPLMGN